MKIVHVIPVLTKGGAERVAADLANRFSNEGHQVTILAAVSRPGEMMPTPLDPGVEIRIIAPKFRSVRSAYFALPSWAFRNRRWLLDQDVVHCHLTFGSVLGTVLQALKWVAGRALPAVVETNHSVGMAIAKWRRRLLQWHLKRRDAVALMALDPRWNRFMAGRPKGSVVLIENGVSQSTQKSVTGSVDYRAKFAILDDTPVVGSVGRMLVERRPDLLLETFAALSAKLEKDVRFIFGGDGPELQAIEEEVQRRGLAQRVHLPGHVTDPSAIFRALDIYLTINVGPATGIAGIEAAMSGLPVIALQMDPAYRPTEDDWIWSSSDTAMLGAQIAELIEDGAKRAAVAARQMRHAYKHHSVDTMAEAYLVFYKAALSFAERG